ncbi:MAG: hypothetical protein Q8N21_05015 [bacterium]|nr:hypothetical protein [bacterium]
MKKILDFLKYNNLTVLILAAIFLFSAGAFAQTEQGQEFIGQEKTRIEGVDNTLLLAADLDNMDMDFKIEKIAQDEEMYFITYTFIDLDKLNNAWQYQLKEKTRKISKKLKKDLGVYSAEELGEEYGARIKELKEEQTRAREQGEEKRVEITEYSGLIGRSLDLAAKVFPGYEPVKEREIASPELVDRTNRTNQADGTDEMDGTDDLAGVYEEYIMAHTEEMAELDNRADEPEQMEIMPPTEEIFKEEIATTTEEIIEPEVEIVELPAE